MVSDGLVFLLLFILGAGALGGGAVLLLRAQRVGIRALGAALALGGAASLLVVVFALPVSAAGVSPEPVVELGARV